MHSVGNSNTKDRPEVSIRKLFRRSDNERRILRSLRHAGGRSAAELAKDIGVSAQSGSVLTRTLEADGFIVRGEPKRGKVGKPSVPLSLSARGAYSIGLRIGRRSADLVLMDLQGSVLKHRHDAFASPTPERVMTLAETGITQLVAGLPLPLRDRIVGIGIATPFELWRWVDHDESERHMMQGWKGFSFDDAFAAFTDLPLCIGNDASLSCAGELSFGDTGGGDDFAYLFVGAFLGGGVVLNGEVFLGSTGNAAGFASLPVPGPDGRPEPLLERASMIVLERSLERDRPGTAQARMQAAEWIGFEDILADWIDATVKGLAHGAASAAALYDVPVVVVDGNMPASVRARIVAGVEAELDRYDLRELAVPEIREGRLGSMAGALGAGFRPITEWLL